MLRLYTFYIFKEFACRFSTEQSYHIFMITEGYFFVNKKVSLWRADLNYGVYVLFY